MLNVYIIRTTAIINAVYNNIINTFKQLKSFLNSKNDSVMFVKVCILYLIILFLYLVMQNYDNLQNLIFHLTNSLYTCLIKDSWYEPKLLNFTTLLLDCYVYIHNIYSQLTDPITTMFVPVGLWIIFFIELLHLDVLWDLSYYIGIICYYMILFVENVLNFIYSILTDTVDFFNVPDTEIYKLHSIRDYNRNIDLFSTLQQPDTNLDYNELLAVNLNQNTHYINNHFPMYKSRVLITLTVWQYWWWMSFVFVITLFNKIILKLILSDNIKINPIIHTSIKSNGRWGDLVASLFPIFWCTNILINSNFILKLTENHTETALFTLRVRGKQWYWVYKTSVNLHSHIHNQPFIIGRNNKIQPYASITKVNPRAYIFKKNKFLNKIIDFNRNQLKLRNSYKYWTKCSLKTVNPGLIGFDLNKLDTVIYNLYKLKTMRSANNNKFKNTINLLLCNKKTKLGIADSLIKLNLIDTVDSRYKKFWLKAFNELKLNKLYKTELPLNLARRQNSFVFKLERYGLLLTVSEVSKIKWSNFLEPHYSKIFHLGPLKKSENLMLWHRNIILDRYETFINTNYLFNAKSMLIYDYRRTEVFADNKVRAALSTIKYSNNLKKKLIEDVIMRSFKADDMGNIKLQKTLNSVIREESCMYINKDLFSMNTSALLKTAFKVYSNFLFQNNFYKLNLQNVNPLRYNKNVYKVFTKKLEILPYYFFNDDTGMRSAKLFVVQYKHKNKYKNYNRHFLTIQQQPVSIWNLSKTMNIIEYENLNYNDTKALSFNRWRSSVNSMFEQAVNIGNDLSIVNMDSIFDSYRIKSKNNNIVGSIIINAVKKNLNIYKLHRIQSKPKLTVVCGMDFTDKLKWLNRHNKPTPSFIRFKKPTVKLNSLTSLTDEISLNSYITSIKINSNKIIIANRLNKNSYFLKTNLKHWGYSKKPIVLNYSNLIFKNKFVNEFYKRKTLSKNRLISCHNVLLVPTKTTIAVVTNSFDVVHSWFIPGLGIKFDCVPGRSTHYTFRVDKPGIYFGHCAEVCGRFHHHMPIKIIAVPLHQFVYYYNVYYPNNDSKRNN